MEIQVDPATNHGPDGPLPSFEKQLPSGSDRDKSQKTSSLLPDPRDSLSVVKFGLILGVAVTILGLSLQNGGNLLRSREQFKSWYSQYSWQFSVIAKDNCTDAYWTYLHGTLENSPHTNLGGAGRYTMFIQPMIDCILEHSSEYMKYQLATSQVVLGITPTIICLLGATTEELCLVALIGRRRLLGLLLSAASPSIYTERAFKYQDPDQILLDLKDNHVKTTAVTRPRWLFVVLEYVAVLAAVANVAALNWEMGVRSINTLSANTIYMPMIWSIFGVLAHLMGAVVFDMRARKVDETTMNPEPRSSLNFTVALKRLAHPPKWSSIRDNIADVVYTELFWLPKDKKDQDNMNNPGAKPPRSGLNKKWRERIDFTLLADSRCFTFLAWLFSVIVIFHIIIGTIILSSTNFVGPKDALAIMARYIISVIICRIILVYELAVLRMNYKKSSGDSGCLPNCCSCCNCLG